MPKTGIALKQVFPFYCVPSRRGFVSSERSEFKAQDTYTIIVLNFPDESEEVSEPNILKCRYSGF